MKNDAQQQLEQIAEIRARLDANNGLLDRATSELLDQWLARPSAFYNDAVRAAAAGLLYAIEKHRAKPPPEAK